MPAPQYVRDKSPRPPRHRRLWVALTFLATAGIGAAVATPPDDHMSDDKGAPAGQLVSAELPTANPMRVVGDDQKLKNDRHGAADQRFCVGGNEGSCVSIQLPKVRMVRVPRATGGQQELAKSGVPYPLKSPGLEKGNSADKKRRNPCSAEIPPYLVLRLGRKSELQHGKRAVLRQDMGPNMPVRAAPAISGDHPPPMRSAECPSQPRYSEDTSSRCKPPGPECASLWPAWLIQLRILVRSQGA